MIAVHAIMSGVDYRRKYGPRRGDSRYRAESRHWGRNDSMPAAAGNSGEGLGCSQGTLTGNGGFIFPPRGFFLDLRRAGGATVARNGAAGKNRTFDPALHTTTAFAALAVRGLDYPLAV